ncbi:MAG TPA: PAS domain S-box protein [bacterium]|nr:PAS domain S-box protein [bacterium]HPN42985.1 PAS domain S-box protein [bacterium]
MKTLKKLSTKFVKARPPLKIVIIYLLIGVLWTIFIDMLFEYIIQNFSIMIFLQSIKGWVFLSITGLILYFLILSDLRKQERKESDIRKIIEYSPIPTIVIDENDNVILMNKKFKDTFGYTENDFLNSRAWFQLAYPDSIYRKEAQELWRKELAQIQNEEKEFSITLLTIVDKHKKKHHIQFHVMALNNRFIIVLNDITNQKIVETALRESESRFRRLFENAGDAIFIMHNDQYIDCNLKALHLFGCPREQLLASSPWQHSPILQPDGQNSHVKARQIIQKAKNTDETILFEWTHSRPDGTFFTTEVSLNRILFNNEIYLQAIIHDITERKTAEHAIHYRTELEKLILTISTRFISLPPEEIDTNIEQALAEICAFIGVDSGYLCRFNNDLSLLTMTHLWCNEKLACVKDEMQNILVNPDNLRIDNILNNKEVNIENLENRKDQTGFEKKLIQLQGAKSLVKVPIVYKEQIVGIIGLTSVQEKQVWIESEISILNMISQIFIGALLRKQNEEELSNRERNYREIFNSTNDAMLIYNIDNNKVVDINNAFLELFGYSFAEIINAHLKDLIKGKILSLVDDDVNLLRNITNESKVYEWQARNKDGENFWVEVSIKKAVIDGQLHALAVIRNIQERKTFEDALKESEKRYREIFENANEAIFVVQGGKIVFLNLKTTEILGFSRAELVSHGIDEFLHPDDRGMVMQRYTKRLQGEQIPARYSFRIIANNKDVKWMDINVVVITWNGQPATLIFMHDITEQIQAQEALKQSEERLTLALEGANDGLWDFNPQTGKAYFSPRWFTMLGYPPDSYPHNLDTLYSLMHPDDLSRVKTDLQQLKDKPLDYISNEFRLRTRDNQWIWIRSRAKTVQKNQSGKVLRMVGTHSDISENKKIEVTLREQDVLLRSVIDNFPFELWARDNNGKCFLQNKYSINIWNDLTGKIPEEVDVPSDIKEFWQCNNARAYAGQVIDEEVEFHDPAGNPCTYQNIIAPIKDGDRMLGILGINIDITKRKKAEEDLQHSERRLAMIFNSVKDMILLAKFDNKKFITIAVNHAFLNEIGRKDKVEGLDLDKIMPSGYAKLVIKDFKNILHYKTSFARKEEKIGNKYYEITSTPIFYDSETNTLLLAVLHDISERKMKEDALQLADRASRLASLGTLAAGISHEINQPLTALKIKVDSLLYWGEENPELMKKNLEQNLQFISREADKIDNIIKHMRSLAQIDQAPPPAQININSIIDNILTLIGQQLQSHRIKVVLKLHEPAPFILAHETPMEQVLINLTINAMYALDSLEKEDKTIILSTRLQNDSCIIEVEDNGPGISEDNITRIFDPFYTTKIGKDGMGLGLAIVQNILSSIGAAITAENVKTGGALFRITLGSK